MLIMRSNNNNYYQCKRAFTLIELLVAVALIAVIVSAVYGSYLAASRSIQRCQARAGISCQCRTLLAQLAVQIRCAYADSPWTVPYADPVKKNTRAMVASPRTVFLGHSQTSTDDLLLRFVTTAPGLFSSGNAIPLTEVAYKLDKNHRMLYYRQNSWLPRPSDDMIEPNWLAVTANVDVLELRFFDGEKWLDRWDAAAKQSLPQAVSIEITLCEENGSQVHYRTVTTVECAGRRHGLVRSTEVSRD